MTDTTDHQALERVSPRSRQVESVSIHKALLIWFGLSGIAWGGLAASVLWLI